MTDDRLLAAFYGDDFTGSADVLQTLAERGLPTVLFLAPPAPDDLARFPGVRAVGVAGTSRAMSPAQMDLELPPVFRALRALGPRFCHYKVCSTFDSAPEIGSIGRAIDLGQAVFGSPFVPLVIGVPAYRRYCLFGQLFAAAGREIVRLDRHPTMSRHPATPMTESDLRLHLARQTSKSIGLFDILDQDGTASEVDERLRACLAERPEILLFDVLDERRLAEIGRLLWELSEEEPLFVAGSSGLEFGLIGHLQAAGVLATPRADALQDAAPVDQLLVMSGSCSPATEVQIARALGHGFVGLELDTVGLVDPSGRAAARSAAEERIVALLRRGESVVAYSARGPQDPAIEQVRAHWPDRGGETTMGNVGQALGTELGRILRGVIERYPLPRVLIAGGDTSGQCARAVGIRALEIKARTSVAGIPVCRAHAPGEPVDGTEFVFKPGQFGAEDFFDSVRAGRLPGEAAPDRQRVDDAGSPFGALGS
ncbi:MAG: four-carbon acid sugar kinase family protein [Candidatus Limnocylindria bacterium]